MQLQFLKGLADLAVATFCFGAAFLGKVTLEGLPVFFGWLMGGALVQYAVAVMELKDGNIAGGDETQRFGRGLDVEG